MLNNIDFDYIESPPNKWTFEPEKVRKMVEKEIEGRTLNLFAGKQHLRHDDEIIRNDLDKDKDADYHFDAREVDEHLEPNSFRTVILDPPYNLRKSREKYEGKFRGMMPIIKNKVAHLVEVGGKVISFGYDTTGMTKSRGFEKEKIYIINHKGDINDTLVLVERKINSNIDQWTD